MNINITKTHTHTHTNTQLQNNCLGGLPSLLLSLLWSFFSDKKKFPFLPPGMLHIHILHNIIISKTFEYTNYRYYFYFYYCIWSNPQKYILTTKYYIFLN